MDIGYLWVIRLNYLLFGDNMNLICPNCNCYIVSKRAHKKYCSGKKDLVVINGKTFFYDCTRKHEHGESCLTQSMVDELSEIVYSNDAQL